MSVNRRGLFACGAAGCALALLAFTVGAALAAAPATTAYHFSSHPMISGRVVAVNDHQMVVDTDQGEQITLQVDTRTMAPRDLAPGMVMRTEFLALSDCRFYAQRVMPIRGGMSTRRLQTYANTPDRGEETARGTAAMAGYREGDRPGEAVPSSGMTMTARPTTSDYQTSTSPMLSGRVISVNDHQLDLATDQGQRVGLVMDSRTMVPGEVAPGSSVRTEFTQLDDGRYYAKRVVHVGAGAANREQAYAHTRDGDLATAASTPDCGSVTDARSNTASAALERRGIGATTPAEYPPTAVLPRPDTLPQTASHQPLILLLGLSALAVAGLVTIVRGIGIA